MKDIWKLEYQNQGKCMSKYQKSKHVWNKLTDFLVINKPNNYAEYEIR